MISDDDLLLYHYRELEAPERARIGAALAAQPELARRLHALVARLDSAAATLDVPVPPEVQRRWEAALQKAAAAGQRAALPRPSLFQQLRWPVAAAAATVCVVLGIQQMRTPPADLTAGNPPPVSTQPAEKSGATAYENGLKFHLASTERRLASLGDATPEERARMVDAIIGQNRIYALAAERAGEPQLARVLRAFTPVLEGVARDDSESTADSLARLSFEIRVMQARLRADRPTTDTL